MAPDSMRRCLYGFLLVCLLVPPVEAQRGRKKQGRPPAAAKSKAPKPAPFSPYVLGPSKSASNPPAKAKPKGPPPVQVAPQPVAEADLVTGAADLTHETVEAQRLALHQHFAVCDLDGNSWLSLREAVITLAFGREEFQRLDADHDGRLLEAELEPRKTEILARLGALPPLPRSAPATDPEAGTEAEAKTRAAPAPRSELRRLYPSPVQLLGRYDLDRSGGLGTEEVQALFSEISLALSAEMVVAQMDPNDSNQLEPLELVPLCFLVSRHLPEALRPQEPEEQPGAGNRAAATLDPDAVDRPFGGRTHFARLDPAGDGAIDDTDLRALQSPARLGIRVEAVLSALDGDGDGRLSQNEFRRAMGLSTADSGD